MELLIGIQSCVRDRPYHQQMRDTWLKNCPVDYKIVVAGPPTAPDELEVMCNDGFRYTAHKIHGLVEYAHRSGYDYLFKCDNDTYVHVPRLLNSGFANHEWTANHNSYGGSGYWLSRKMMGCLLESPPVNWPTEDHWVTDVLRGKGFEPFQDSRYHSLTRLGPRPDNDLITAHYYGRDNLQVKGPERLGWIRDYHRPWE